MSVARRKLERKIRDKEEEIQQLERTLTAGKAYLQGLQDALKFIPNEGDGEESENSLDVVLRSGSSTDAAYQALRKHGKPLQIMDLLKAIGREPTPENRGSIGSTIAAYVRRGQLFSRPAPNTYGLLEWEDNGDSDDDGPPPSFGGPGKVTDIDADIPV